MTRATVSAVADEEGFTASELELMTPNERHQLINSRVVTDLSLVDPTFLRRVQAKGRVLLESRGVLDSHD